MSQPIFTKSPNKGTPFSTFVFLVFLLGVLYLFYLVIRPFLLDLFVATVTAMVFSPFYTKIKGFLKDQRIPAALATLFLILLVFLIPLSLFSGLITAQSLDLYEKISKGLQDGSLQKAINLRLLSFNLFFDRWNIDLQTLRLEEQVGKILTTFSEFVYTEMTVLARGVASFFLDLVIVLFVTFFLLIDGEKFLAEVRLLSPLENAHYDRILNQLTRTIKATLKGSVVVALVQGFLGGVRLLDLRFAFSGLLGDVYGLQLGHPPHRHESYLGARSRLFSLFLVFLDGPGTGLMGDLDRLRVG